MNMRRIYNKYEQIQIQTNTKNVTKDDHEKNITNTNKYKIKGLNDGGVMEPSGVFSITALYVFPYSTFLCFAHGVDITQPEHTVLQVH